MRRLPTSIARCDPMRDEKACGLLQMEYTVPPSILYSSYWYVSGTNQTMRNHLNGIVQDAIAVLGRQPKLVLDIGCNDGTLLNYYSPETEKFGIDPSDVAAKIVAPNTTVIQDLFPCTELAEKLQGRQFDLVTSIAMFYDLESPVEFARNISQHLSPNGIWVFEMSYMPTMLEKCSYDTICHEHLEYYSLAVIERILKLSHLKLVKASLNDCNGGSLRCLATHEKNFAFKNPEYLRQIDQLRQSEFDLALDTDQPYRRFQERINLHKVELNQLITKLRNDGKTIHIYGASTKGNTILQWCDIDAKLIQYAAERSPAKYGARTIGTGIQIISEEESRAMKPDYYLVLPWHFRKEMVERERETIANGTAMIFPLPHIEIVKRD